MAVQSILMSVTVSFNCRPWPWVFILTDGENLRAVHPSDALPGRAVDEAVQVDAHLHRQQKSTLLRERPTLTHGQVSPSISVHVPLRRRGSGIGPHDVPANVPHGDGADKGTPNEAVPAADLFHEPHGEDDHAKRLGDAVEARGEKLGGGAREAKRLEDARRVCAKSA